MKPTATTPVPTRILSTFALGALTALTLTTGCTADPEPDPTPTDLASTPSAEEIQAASQAAETALRTYYQVSSQCLADPPNTEPSCFDQVAVDQVLQGDSDALATAQEYEFRYIGNIEVVSVEIGNVDLDSIAQIEVTACVDATSYEAVDSAGTPVAPRDENSPARHLVIYEIRNYAYPSATGWRVGQVLDPEVVTTPC